MTRQEAVAHIAESRKAELGKLPVHKRAARLADLLARYRKEHPDESAAWSAQYI